MSKMNKFAVNYMRFPVFSWQNSYFFSRIHVWSSAILWILYDTKLNKLSAIAVAHCVVIIMPQVDRSLLKTKCTSIWATSCHREYIWEICLLVQFFFKKIYVHCNRLKVSLTNWATSIRFNHTFRQKKKILHSFANKRQFCNQKDTFS